MSSQETTMPDFIDSLAALAVKRQLFEVVRRVCQVEKGVSLEYPEINYIENWSAPGAQGIGLDNTNLTHPLKHPHFKVKDATLVAGDVDSAFSLRIVADPEAHVPTFRKDAVPFAYDYEKDVVATDILDMFKDFLLHHPHEQVCVSLYRERKQKQRAAIAVTEAQKRAAQTYAITDKRRII